MKALLSALALCVASLAGTVVSQSAKAPTPPNIVYILLDDAGWGDLGCYGQDKVATPHIDRLAAEGMRFTQHYAGSTVCAPTRSVLMTGLHTGHTPVRGNGQAPGEPEGVFPIGGDTVTVATLLKRAGYTNGCFGKWGLGGPGSESDALELGFDHFCGYYNQAFAHDYYPRWLWRDGEKLELDREVYSHNLIFDAAVEFIREHKGAPFFCYLPVTIPHAAMQPPPAYQERFREQFPQFENKSGNYGGDKRRVDVQNPIAAFAAMMTKLDDDVGALMALLRELDLDDNTVVMLSSDNGPHREGGHDPEFWNSNGPLRGLKRALYEGGIRVPMIARWPGKIAAGSTSDHISAQWDVLPTMCDIAGIETPSGLDGLSMAPTLLDKGEQQQHPYLYWEFFEQGGRRAIRMGHWKAVQNGLRKGLNGPVELYDLDKDLGERHDVSADHPNLVAEARKLFDEAHTDDPNWQFPRKKRRRDR